MLTFDSLTVDEDDVPPFDEPFELFPPRPKIMKRIPAATAKSVPPPPAAFPNDLPPLAPPEEPDEPDDLPEPMFPLGLLEYPFDEPTGPVPNPSPRLCTPVLLSVTCFSRPLGLLF